MKFIRYFAVSLLFCSSSVCLADTHGKTTTETTDAAGTTVKTETEHSDKTGWTGTRKIENVAKSTTDPKGLGNKVTESAKVETVAQKDGDSSETKTSVDAAGTKHKSEVEQDVSKNWDGGTTTTTTHRAALDPKGLGNKQTAETKEKITRDASGKTSTEVTKKVNGETVEERKSE